MLKRLEGQSLVVSEEVTVVGDVLSTMVLREKLNSSQEFVCFSSSFLFVILVALL